MAVGSVFFSAAPTAQNSPELNFPFINYLIQPSLVESLAADYSHQNVYLVSTEIWGFSNELPL
jgi:hypothetical protein